MAAIIYNYGGEVYTDHAKKIVYAGSSKPTDKNISEAEVVEEPVSTEVAEKRRGRSHAGNGDQSLPTSGVLFAYIDMIGCTTKEAQEAEAMLRQVAQKSPKEIAGVVRRLQQAHRLRAIDSKAGFVREFNNHFGVQLKETSFYSAFK